VSVNGAGSTFAYNKKVTSLDELGSEEPVPDDASPVHYFNRWNRSLDANNHVSELVIDIPAELITELLIESKDMTEDAEKILKHQTLQVKIEYELSGSYEGLRFMKTLSKDGSYYDVRSKL